MRKADNLPQSCAVVTKSGNLNFLEPSGPLQACNWNDLPFLPFTSCTTNSIALSLFSVTTLTRFQSSTPASVTLPLFSKTSYSKKFSGKINYVRPSVRTSTPTQVSREETLTKIVMGLSTALKLSEPAQLQ